MTHAFTAFALNTATGALRWTSSVTRLGSDPGSTDGALSADGTQLVITGSYAGGGGIVTADIDATTGATRWTRFYVGVCGGSATFPVATLSPDGADVYVSCPGIVIDYASTNGLIRWRQTTNGGTSVAVSPGGSVLYTTGFGASGGYQVSALSAATGTAQWSGTLDGTAEEFEPPALALSPNGSRVYLAGQYILQAYDAGSGAPAWTAQPGDESDLVVSPHGSRVYLIGGASPVAAENGFSTSAWRA